MYSVYVPDINNKIINDLIEEHKSKKLPRYNKLMKYYKGEHDILNRSNSDASRANNKLVNDYPGYIIDTIQGYFIGIPVKYSTDINEDCLRALKDVFDSNNETDHNAEMVKHMSIYGEVYELLYTNEDGNIRFVRLKNEETILVFDSDFQRSIQMALRYYDLYDTETKKNQTKVEVYYSDRVEYYTRYNETYMLEDTKPHYFKKVPVVYYNNNDECIGDFEKVITLIDDYNKRISDNSNELEDFRNSYLKVKNMSGTSADDLREVKRLGAFMIEGDGDVSFVEKNINDSYTEHHMERLDTNIHKFSKVPNLSDEHFAGNRSDVAIKYKLWSIEQIASCKERKFKTGLMRRIKLICEIFNLKEMNYNWKDINIAFKRNIPSNVLESSQIAANIKGIVSDETLLSILPFVESPDMEMKKIKAEQEAELNYSLLSNT